jgi:hypothetical protein
MLGLVQASAIRRLSAADSIHRDQQDDGDDHDHNNDQHSFLSRECQQLDETVKAHWNPTLSVHVQARLPLVASHRHHDHEPSFF